MGVKVLVVINSVVISTIAFFSLGLCEPFITQDAYVLTQKKYQFKCGADYTVYADSYWDKDGHRQIHSEGYQEMRLIIPLEINYGLTNDLEAGIILPYVLRKLIQDDFSDEKTGEGIGDITLTGKYKYRDLYDHFPFIFSWALGIKFPTGAYKLSSDKLNIGTGSTDLTINLYFTEKSEASAGKTLYGHLNLGFVYAGNNRENVNIDDRLFAYYALEYFINRRVGLIGELHGQLSGNEKLKKWMSLKIDKRLLSLSLAMGYNPSDLPDRSIKGGIQYRLIGKDESAAIRPFIEITYVL